VSAWLPSSAGDLPDIAQALQAILQRVPPAERPLLIALAERLAAERYRDLAVYGASLRARNLLASLSETSAP